MIATSSPYYDCARWREQQDSELLIDLERMIRELRPRITQDSQPWIRQLYAELRSIQRRLGEVR